MGYVKTILISLGVALVVILINNNFAPVSVGGTVNIGMRDFPDGISVDGTTVVDENATLKAPISGTSGVFSSTLSVTGATALSSTLGVTGVSSLGTSTGKWIAYDGTVGLASSSCATTTVLTVKNGLVTACN